MKGSYSFTICGDPLFFAPEIVNHQGYDYAADLWALGVLIFELYEECSPFGSADTDETTIFKRISAFKGELPFTDKTPAAARAAVSGWLNPAPQLRTGYLMDDAVKNCALFSGTLFAKLISLITYCPNCTLPPPSTTTKQPRLPLPALLPLSDDLFCACTAQAPLPY